MSQQPDLLEFTKESVKRIAADFDKPGADFLPTLLLRMPDGNVAICGLAGDMNSQNEKDEIARFMIAACACARTQEVCFVSSAWAVKYEPPPGEKLENWKEVEQREDFVMPRDHPQRIEVVNVMCSRPSGDIMASAEITRHEDEGKPPTIGDWEEMGGEGTTLGGRFGDAIHDGIDLGQKMDSDETPPEMRAYMDEMIANGKFEDLVRSFMRAMTTASEMRRKGGK
jgi:hypothetical protein